MKEEIPGQIDKTGSRYKTQEGKDYIDGDSEKRVKGWQSGTDHFT